MTLTAHLPPAVEPLTIVLERVTGPFNGYFLASYAVPWLGTYVGYSKICVARPSNVWECTARQKVSSRECSNIDDAIEAAEVIAKMLIVQVPSSSQEAVPNT